jgi:hypothetical protein
MRSRQGWLLRPWPSFPRAAGALRPSQSGQPHSPGHNLPRSSPDLLGPRYGISVSLPPGWDGRVGRGVVQAATFPLPPEHLPCWVEMACGRLTRTDVRVVLFENGRENRPPVDLGEFPELSGDIQLEATDFGPSDGNSEDSLATGHGFARRTFQLSGRLFVLFVETGSLPPTADALAGLNDLLGSLVVEPGDFYPGTVEPARFPERRGWHAGTSGPDEAGADGEFTTSWAATIPYADEWNALPPFKTLERLPPDGILIWLGLTRSNRLPPLPQGDPCCPARTPPFRLAEFDRRGSWEGQIRPEVPEYVLWGTLADRQRIDLRIYFGRRDPTEAMLAEAQAMLNGIELPDWGPWETD